MLLASYIISLIVRVVQEHAGRSKWWENDDAYGLWRFRKAAQAQNWLYGWIFALIVARLSDGAARMKNRTAQHMRFLVQGFNMKALPWQKAVHLQNAESQQATGVLPQPSCSPAERSAHGSHSGKMVLSLSGLAFQIWSSSNFKFKIPKVSLQISEFPGMLKFPNVHCKIVLHVLENLRNSENVASKLSIKMAELSGKMIFQQKK